ncbi:MAG: hypothetical protein U0W40_12695 [Acidimicrobiia bacterium]
MNFAIRAAAAAAAVFAVSLGAGSGARAGATAGAATGSPASGSQAAALQERATGTWTSEYGTLEFRDDGTATFAIRNCGVTRTKPGFGTVGNGCDPTVYTGQLSVRDHAYAITEADGGIVDLQAYVDDDQALHVGVGTIGSVRADRTGTVELWPHDTLKIGKRTCTWAPFVSGKKITAKCGYRTADGRTVLVYRAPDTFEQGKTRLEGLVLVPGARLLVDPGLVPLVYARA